MKPLCCSEVSGGLAHFAAIARDRIYLRHPCAALPGQVDLFFLCAVAYLGLSGGGGP